MPRFHLATFASDATPPLGHPTLWRLGRAGPCDRRPVALASPDSEAVVSKAIEKLLTPPSRR